MKKSLMLPLCIIYATVADSYVVIKDKNSTAEVDDNPFTVHHVDEVHNM